MIARRLKREGGGVRRAWKTARAYGKSITQPLPAARAEFFPNGKTRRSVASLPSRGVIRSFDRTIFGKETEAFERKVFANLSFSKSYGEFNGRNLI